MNRLLMAAARGARLQVMADNNWYGVTKIYMPFRKDARAIRIHPDDAHLEYGPVSTALRKYAETGKTQYTLTAMLAMAAYNHEKEYLFILASEWPHASMFALILAEALCDEGL